MAGHWQALNEQLRKIVDSLKEQGMLDKQFGVLGMLKESDSPFFLAEIITMFCQCFQTILRDLALILDKEPVDYYDVGEICVKIKGCTSSIGARRIALACATLHQASDEKNKDGCILAMNGIKHEYYNLKSSLDSIVQLERRILCHFP